MPKYKYNSSGDIVENNSFGGTIAKAGNFGTVTKNGQYLTGLDDKGELVFGTGNAPAAQSQTYMPKTEPAVLTSSTIANEVVPDNKQKLSDLSKKGTYVGEDNKMYYSDGSLVPAPVGATYGSDGWEFNGQTYGADPQYVPNEDNDPYLDTINSMMASIKASSDSATSATISAIERQFDGLRADQREINRRAEQGRARTLLTSGAARYSPLTATGITMAQASYGLRQIQNLDASEDAAIANAKAAQASGNMKLMDDAIGIISNIRKEKADAAAKVAEELRKAREASQKAIMQASRDSAVADLLAQGVTDPSTILNYLNFDEAGNQIGDFSAEEINKAIDNLKPVSDKKDLYKFSNDDVGKLLSVGMNGDMIQQVQDYYNGRGTAPKLTAAQTAAVQKVLGAPSGTDDSYEKLPSSVRTKLLGSGLTKEDVENIERDVSTYGIEAVLARITDEGQKKAVQDAYGVESKVKTADIETQVDIAMRKGELDMKEILLNNYTREELNDLAEQAGASAFFDVSDDELEKYLASPEGKEEGKRLYIELLKDEYRAAGLLEE